MILAQKYDKEYLPITGFPEFTKQAAILAYGKDSAALKEGRVRRPVSLSFAAIRYLPSNYFRSLSLNLSPVPERFESEEHSSNDSTLMLNPSTFPVLPGEITFQL